MKVTPENQDLIFVSTGQGPCDETCQTWCVIYLSIDGENGDPVPLAKAKFKGTHFENQDKIDSFIKKHYDKLTKLILNHYNKKVE